jgi:nitrogen fixation protein NifB
MEYLRRSIAHDPRISVAAIAGPGDAFANPEETLATLRGIRKEFPDIVACLSSNGLNMAPYIPDLVELGVNYVTMTINAVDPIILAEIYSWVRFNRRTYRGIAAAQIMVERQMECLEELKRHDFTVKVNTVVLPGINDQHIIEVAKHLSMFKVNRMNCIPVLPNENTFFAEIPAPEKVMMDQIIAQASLYVPMMAHCNRCRSDAAGMLGEDDVQFRSILKEVSKPTGANGQPPRVAIATQEGIFINQHLGEAEVLSIFEPSTEAYRMAGEKSTQPRGLGDARWSNLATDLAGIDVLMVSGIGPRPLEILTEKGIRVYEVTGFIDEYLDKLFRGETIESSRTRADFSCGTECKGSGTGCMS